MVIAYIVLMYYVSKDNYKEVCRMKRVIKMILKKIEAEIDSYEDIDVLKTLEDYLNGKVDYVTAIQGTMRPKWEQLNDEAMKIQIEISNLQEWILVGLEYIPGCKMVESYLINGEQGCPINRYCKYCDMSYQCRFYQSLQESEWEQTHRYIRALWNEIEYNKNDIEDIDQRLTLINFVWDFILAVEDDKVYEFLTKRFDIA